MDAAFFVGLVIGMAVAAALIWIGLTRYLTRGDQ